MLPKPIMQNEQLPRNHKIHKIQLTDTDLALRRTCSSSASAWGPESDFSHLHSWNCSMYEVVLKWLLTCVSKYTYYVNTNILQSYVISHIYKIKSLNIASNPDLVVEWLGSMASSTDMVQPGWDGGSWLPSALQTNKKNDTNNTTACWLTCSEHGPNWKWGHTLGPDLWSECSQVHMTKHRVYIDNMCAYMNDKTLLILYTKI